jgi:hypothetical protein
MILILLAGKQIINDLSGVYEKRREKLVKNVKRSVKAYKFRYQVCTTEKLLRQQQEAIDLKQRELELKIEETTVGITEILPPGGNEDSRSEVDKVIHVD